MKPKKDTFWLIVRWIISRRLSGHDVMHPSPFFVDFNFIFNLMRKISEKQWLPPAVFFPFNRFEAGIYSTYLIFFKIILLNGRNLVLNHHRVPTPSPLRI